jgi:DNA-binding SARP family transcriptional activator
MIRLQTLGTLDLRDAEGTEFRAVLAQPRRLALLVYLAAARPHGFHRRDTVLSLFWPERNTERARAALNRALYFLRHELGDAVVLSRGDDEIGIDPRHIWCDAAAFEDATAGRRDRDAVELYRGDLLPGFFLSEAPGFEAWLESRRTQLRETASAAAWSLAGREEAAGNFGLATDWARRGVELAPFHEDAFRRLLALLQRTGDRAGAVHAYDTYAAELARELDVAPAPETRALMEAIRTRAPGDSPRESRPSLPSPAPLSTSSPTPSRAWWGIAATALVLAVGGIVLLPGNDATIDPLRVEVAPLENRTGDRSLDRLGLVAAERLIGAIRLSATVSDVGLPGGARTGARAGTLVTGAMDRDGDSLVLRVQVTDVGRRGQPWEVAPVLIPAGAIDSAIDRVRPRVVGAVAVLRNIRHASLLPLGSAPPAFEAYQEFLEGMKLQLQGQLADALRHFRYATALDSSFTWPLVQGGLASLYSFLPDQALQVDSFANSLSRVRGRLLPLQTHLLDHMLAVRTDDWVASYRAIRAAAELAPDHFSYRLANLANQQNRPREAAEALTRPRMDSIYRGNIQGYWYVLTFSLHLLDEHRSELEQARRARRHRPASSSALFQEIRALAALGRLPAVRARLDTLISLPREGWFTPGAALTLVGTDLRAHGHGEAAAEVFERALAWYRSRPAEEQASQDWRERVGDLLYVAGRWADADTAYGSLAREYPTSRGYPDNVAYLGRIGTIAARRGDSTLARRMFERLREMERAQPVPGQEAVVFRARIAALLGRRAEALRLLVDGFGPAGTTELHDDFDFDGMKSYPPYREFLRPKG